MEFKPHLIDAQIRKFALVTISNKAPYIERFIKLKADCFAQSYDQLKREWARIIIVKNHLSFSFSGTGCYPAGATYAAQEGYFMGDLEMGLSRLGTFLEYDKDRRLLGGCLPPPRPVYN